MNKINTRASSPLCYAESSNTTSFHKGATQNGRTRRRNQGAGADTRLEAHAQHAERNQRPASTGKSAGIAPCPGHGRTMSKVQEHEFQSFEQHTGPGALGGNGCPAGSLCMLGMRLHRHKGAQPDVSQADATVDSITPTSGAAPHASSVSTWGLLASSCNMVLGSIAISTPLSSYGFNSGLRLLGLSQFWPIKCKVIRPALHTSETPVRLDFDLRSQFAQAIFRNALALHQPLVNAGRLDVQHARHGGHATQDIDDFRIVHVHSIGIPYFNVYRQTSYFLN